MVLVSGGLGRVGVRVVSTRDRTFDDVLVRTEICRGN